MVEWKENDSWYILLTQGCILTKLIVRLLPIISDIATCICNKLFCQITQIAIANFFQCVKFLVLSIILAIRHDSLLGRCLVQLCSYRNLNLRQRKVFWYTASYLRSYIIYLATSGTKISKLKKNKFYCN